MSFATSSSHTTEVSTFNVTTKNISANPILEPEVLDEEYKWEWKSNGNLDVQHSLRKGNYVHSK